MIYRVWKDRVSIEEKFIQSVKEIRYVTDWGLREAKEAAEILRYNDDTPLHIELNEKQAQQFKDYGFTVTRKFEIDTKDIEELI